MLQHNEVRELTAYPLSEVCANVAVEPALQEFSGKSLHVAANRDGGARLDIAVDGFWGSKEERIYMDVQVLNPFAPSHRKEGILSESHTSGIVCQQFYVGPYRVVVRNVFLSVFGGFIVTI